MKLLGIRRISIIAGLSLLATNFAAQAQDEPYDTLDGTGKSGKTVNVIEWEGNLEVHVYPKGSLKGLALKLDKKNKDKPVMVIGYRFDNDSKKQLIRRAVLGIPLNEGFKTYRDLTADDYDKVIISNNGLQPSREIVAFNIDPDPTQLYPDGHPANDEKKQEPQRAVASEKKAAPKSSVKKEALGPDSIEEPKIEKLSEQEDGEIKPFKW